jgi:hypothetical protein
LLFGGNIWHSPYYYILFVPVGYVTNLLCDFSISHAERFGVRNKQKSAMSYDESMLQPMHEDGGDDLTLKLVRHSRSGVAAFVLSLVSFAILFCVIISVGLMHDRLHAASDSMKTIKMIIGLSIIMAGIMGVVALIFGVFAVFRAGYKKALGIAGVVIASVSVLIAAMILVIGIVARR